MPNTLEDKDWALLLRRIKDGECTPFLGSGAFSEEIPVISQIVNKWATNYHYPMGDSDDLTRVAQFVALKEDEMFPRKEICNKIKELLKEVAQSYFDVPDEIHGVLADLPLPVYITTTYDDLMLQALESHGKTSKNEICRWKESHKKRKRTLSDFDPTSEKPLVYHLYGCYKEPESLVLTEENYLDFLAAISREQDLISPRIQEAFTRTSLLLLGYRINDWDFRILCRILDEYIGKSLTQKKHYSVVQLVPGDVPEAHKEEALEYLDRYFEELHIQVYWQDCREFAKELRIRWEAFSHEIEPPIAPVIPIPYPCQIKEEANKVSILFLAADPTDASHLRLGKEFQEIQEKLQLAKFRDRFTLKLPQLSVRPPNISQALLSNQPQIVHFSGHGTSTGELCFEDEDGKSHYVEPDALAALFKQFSGQVECVILNACYSEIQARAIAKHIKYVIGMNRDIGDKAAIAFSVGFYQALGEGRTFEGAYDLGCVQIQLQNQRQNQLQNIPEHLTPVLIKKGT